MQISATAPTVMSVILSCVIGCSSNSPTVPSPTPTPTPTPLPFVTSGRLLDVLTGAGVAGVRAAGTGITGGPSDPAGVIGLAAEMSLDAPRPVTLTNATIVERQVAMKIPGGDVVLSLIPSSFDLNAFDEMMRVTQLQRWVAAPPLRVVSRVLQFTSTGASVATGLDEVLTEEERAALEADLTWALPQLTGNQFPAFASITRETVAEGASVSVLNTGVISVARFKGLTAATGYWGYSRWQFRTDGTVISGTIMLDRDFEKSGSIFRRSLRSHELGHALGYTHVTLRQSVMNQSARIEPNAFDLQAARIAFQRPPGNRRPDTDPAGLSANVASRSAVWSVGAGAGGPALHHRAPVPHSRRSTMRGWDRHLHAFLRRPLRTRIGL
jgi:hypothetical protein